MSRRAITLATMAALGLGTLGACVDVDTEADAGDPAVAPARVAQPGAAVAGGRAAATYRVPLPDGLADLRDVASFAVAAAHVERDGAQVAIVFTLPAGLLGVDVEVRLDGVQHGDLAEVAGPLGAGTCRLGPTVRCDLAYRPLVYTVDLDAVARYWRGLGDVAVDRRLIVSSLFDSDPLGVLELTLD